MIWKTCVWGAGGRRGRGTRGGGEERLPSSQEEDIKAITQMDDKNNIKD